MKPIISIVIVAFNEEKLLPRCLTSLQEQNFPKEKYEVIVIDNGSTDKTAQIAKQFGAQVFFYNDLQGCGPARKFGADKAKGSILAFTDADCYVPRNWLTQIETLFADPRVVCIGGQAKPDNKKTFFRFVFFFHNVFHIINHMFHKPIVWGFSMAMRKTAYQKVGGINEKLLSSEDWELVIRLQKQFGAKSIRYVQSIRVYTSTRKYKNAKIFSKYALNGVKNYIDLIILGKVKAIPLFNVR